MNVGWDEQFLAPLWLIPLIPGIPGMSSKSQEKYNLYCTKLTLVTQEFKNNKTFPDACPKVVPEGPEVVKGGALGDFGVPLGTLVAPFASPRTPLGVPLDRPGSIWGLTKTLWALQGTSRHPTI